MAPLFSAACKKGKTPKKVVPRRRQNSNIAEVVSHRVLGWVSRAYCDRLTLSSSRLPTELPELSDATAALKETRPIVLSARGAD